MFNFDMIDKPVDLNAGEWVDDVPGYPGARFKVRTSSYKPFVAAHDRLLRSFGAVENITATDEYRKGSGALMSEHLLLDWDKAVVKGGKVAPYDRKSADTILTSIDERGIGQAFRGAVSYCANTVATRHLGLAESISENL